MNSRTAFRIFLLVVLASIATFAKEPPGQVISWPESGSPVLRFSFGKFKEIGGVGSQHTYVTDTTAENLGTKSIPDATFTLFIFSTRIKLEWAKVS